MNTEEEGPVHGQVNVLGMTFVAHIAGWDLWVGARKFMWAQDKYNRWVPVTHKMLQGGPSRAAGKQGFQELIQFAKAWHAITQ